MITEVEIKEKVKENPPTASNAFGHVALVTYLTKNLQSMLQYNKGLVQEVNAQLNKMRIDIEISHEEIKKIGIPALQSLRNRLHEINQAQKQQNTFFSEQVTQLKKQKSILTQVISAANKKVQKLKDQTGSY